MKRSSYLPNSLLCDSFRRTRNAMQLFKTIITLKNTFYSNSSIGFILIWRAMTAGVATRPVYLKLSYF